VAFITVRLNDVAPEGTSARVTYGLLNLTHRDAHETPEPLEPGKRYVVTVTMNAIAHAFPAGHRVRLALSTCYWPIVWPAPQPVTLSVFTANSFVDLPMRAPDPSDSALRLFESPERAASEVTELRLAAVKRIVERDRATDETVYTISSAPGDLDSPELLHIKAIDLNVGYTLFKRFRIAEDDPATAHAEVIHKTWFCRGNWKPRIETHTYFSSSSADFILQAEVTAYENGEQFFRREWFARIKRDLV